jgi:hypothetical protein
VKTLWAAIRFFVSRFNAFIEHEAEYERRITNLKRLEAVQNLPIWNPGNPVSVEHLRWTVLLGYGFMPAAVRLIEEAPLTITDINHRDGGGLTYENHIALNGVQHEAALHEFCHWIFRRMIYTSTDGWRDRYLYAYRRLADGDGSPLAAAFAKLQLEGNGVWPGVLADPQIYGHEWVSLASWHMGQYKTGPRTLPEYLWPFFAEAFSGQLLLEPYYVGRHA